MAALTAVSPSIVSNAGAGGTIGAWAAGASGGDTVPCGDGTFLIAKNSSGGALIITIGAYPSSDPDTGNAIADPTYSIAAAGEKWIGPLRGAVFGNPADGRAYLTYSANPPTGLTLAVVKVN